MFPRVRRERSSVSTWPRCEFDIRRNEAHERWLVDQFFSPGKTPGQSSEDVLASSNQTGCQTVAVKAKINVKDGRRRFGC